MKKVSELQFLIFMNRHRDQFLKFKPYIMGVEELTEDENNTYPKEWKAFVKTLHREWPDVRGSVLDMTIRAYEAGWGEDDHKG